MQFDIGPLRTASGAGVSVGSVVTLLAMLLAPARASAQAPAGDEPAEPPASIVSLVSSDPPTSYFHKTGVSVGVERGTRRHRHFYADNYEDLCTPPCTVTMRSGWQTLALSNGGIPVAAPPVSLPAGPVTLKGEYVSRDGVRYGWYGTGAAIALIGFVLTVHGSMGHSKQVCGPLNNCIEQNDPDGAEIAGGIGMLMAGIVVFGIGATTPDEARIRVFPGVPSLALRTGEAVAAADARSGALAARGLTWSLSW